MSKSVVSSVEIVDVKIIVENTTWVAVKEKIKSFLIINKIVKIIICKLDDLVEIKVIVLIYEDEKLKMKKMAICHEIVRVKISNIGTGGVVEEEV